MPLFTPLQVEKLSDLAKRGRIASLYVFVGPYSLINEAAKKIYEVLLAQGSILEVYDLRTPEGKRDFFQTRGYQEGLFGIKKVYLIYGAEEIKEEKAEEIKQKIERHEKPPFSFFLLSESLSEEHPLYKLAKDVGAVIPFPQRKKEDLLEIELTLTLKEKNCHMGKEVASLFLSLVGEDYHHFRNELEKLLLYVGFGREITEEEVLKVISPLPSATLFLLGDTLLQQGTGKALSLIQNLLDAKIDSLSILLYLYRYFKKMEIFQEFLKFHQELATENYYSVFVKKWQEIKQNPAFQIPQILAESHPYSLFSMKKNLKKVKSFFGIFKALFQGAVSLRKDFRKEEEVFPQVLLEIEKNLFFGN